MSLCLAGLLRRPPPPRLGVRRRKRTKRKVLDRPRLRLTFLLDALGRSLGRSYGRSLGGARDASISLREDHILIHVHIAADVAVDGRVLVEVGIDRIEGLGGSEGLRFRTGVLVALLVFQIDVPIDSGG